MQWIRSPVYHQTARHFILLLPRDSISGIDIYYTTKWEDGSWSKAIRLGSTINTNGNEKSPFFHSDSRSLYFLQTVCPDLVAMIFLWVKWMTKAIGANRWMWISYQYRSGRSWILCEHRWKTGYFASNKINNGAGGIYIPSICILMYVQTKYIFNAATWTVPGMKIVKASIEIKRCINKTNYQDWCRFCDRRMRL